MTFRTRVIVATTSAVTVAVLLACLASYFSTRNAVQRSVDDSLYSSSRGKSIPGEGATVPGVFYQIVLADGTQLPPSALPVDATVLAVANLKLPETFRTVYVGSAAYRELLVPLPKGTVLHCDSGPCSLKQNAAQIYAVNISGQQHQLHELALRLLILALCGVVFAMVLGYVAARAALKPLEIVTNQIEEIAETSNIARRLDEGRNDELGRLRRVFNQLLSSVDGSQRLQRQLVLDASHELRTPLTSLRTNAQVLSRADRLTSEELVQITDDMVAQVDELAVLISDLAELARGEGVDGTVETIRLADLVDELSGIAGTHARARSVTLDIVLDDDTAGGIVKGHRDRVTRAVNNLINNAIKFAPEGGHVNVHVHGGTIEVADDGPGVADEDVPFVFDRFWRSPKARALPGSGLGLAIVTQVAQEMGGSINVARSRELGGALFTLELPEVPE